MSIRMRTALVSPETEVGKGELNGIKVARTAERRTNAQFPLFKH
jgi:hypothetical protein